MRITALLMMSALAACSARHPATISPAVVPVGSGGVVIVHLSNFAFDPSLIRFRAGVPVRLRLVNDSDGGHDFSAPAFFAASSFAPGVPAPPNGTVQVAPHQSVELDLVPREPGTYDLECTHFLHSLFGMTGTIEITRS
jgi:uncharacterized cupredoxin-like copper-binding protein